MFESFTKKPFTDRIKDTAYLLKNSFSVIGRDTDIIRPPVRMLILSIIMTTFVFLALATFFTGTFVLVGIVLLLFTIIILVPFSFFYYTRQKANQSWIVYNTITGKDISYRDAVQHTKSQKGKLRILAIIDLVMKYLGSIKGQKKGIKGLIIHLIISFLEEVWDLLQHYMLPAVVIEQKSLREIIPQIKELRNNVPATLVGVFGIDFVGNVVGMAMVPIYLVALALSVVIGFLLAMATDVTVITLGGFSFSWLPILIVMYLVVVFGCVIGKLVDSTKVIYFTIFYTSIMRPKEIIPDLRKELTNYLQMKRD